MAKSKGINCINFLIMINKKACEKKIARPLLLLLLANGLLGGNAQAAPEEAGVGEAGSTRAAVSSSATGTVIGRAPTMTTPRIIHNDTNGNLLVDAGDLLNASSGTFSDADGDRAITSAYRWLNGDSVLSTSPNYTITAADLGATITLGITPRTDSAITDPSSGVEVTSTLAVTPGTYVREVVITGFVSGAPQVGTELTATPTCLTTCGAVAYQWKLETGYLSATYADIVGQTSARYTPRGSDQLKRIRVSAN